MVGASVGMHDSCGFAQDAVTTEGLEKYSVLIPANISGYLNVCLNGDGDLANYTNLDQDLSFAFSVLNFSDAFTDYDINSTFLTTFASINFNLELVDIKKQGYLNISDPTVDVEDQPATNLNTLCS